MVIKLSTRSCLEITMQGRSHNTKTDCSSFETVEQFIHLGTTLTNKTSIQEEIKSRLKSFGAEYFVFQRAIQKYKD
jgi:hypothetical protein